MLVARRILLSGHVQGVGFRFFAQEAAAIEGLSGWIRNLADGRVEALVEGEREAVERFERKIRRGPPAARIDAVTVQDEDAAAGRGGGFRVRS